MVENNTRLDETTLINIRRHLHMIPELALAETQTSAYIRQVIAQYQTKHVQVYTVPTLPTATIVKIKGYAPKRNLGYRTDIDALAINENNKLAFKSQHQGIMHACGHDVHMTIALGLVAYFAKQQPQDNIIIIFQPAEENFAGGMKLYDSGILTGELALDEIYALHTRPDLPAGAIGCRVGTLFAGTTEIHAKFKGLGGHAAFPQETKDMVVALTQWVNQLQTIIARNVDPIKGGVVTIGQISAGSANNVIAGSAQAHGTIRALQQETIEIIKARIMAISTGIATSFDCKIDVELNQAGYLPVVNPPKITQRFIDYVSHTTTIDYREVPPAMTGEDFGYLLSKIPGMMFWLGVDSPAPLHSSDYLVNEQALKKAQDILIDFLTDRMKAED